MSQNGYTSFRGLKHHFKKIHCIQPRGQNGYTSSGGLKQKSPLRIWRGLLIIVLACGDNGTDWLDLISNKKSYVTFQKRKVQITTETS
jgi:hypothetical protein